MCTAIGHCRQNVVATINLFYFISLQIQFKKGLPKQLLIPINKLKSVMPKELLIPIETLQNYA